MLHNILWWLQTQLLRICTAQLACFPSLHQRANYQGGWVEQGPKLFHVYYQHVMGCEILKFLICHEKEYLTIQDIQKQVQAIKILEFHKTLIENRRWRH